MTKHVDVVYKQETGMIGLKKYGNIKHLDGPHKLLVIHLSSKTLLNRKKYCIWKYLQVTGHEREKEQSH